MQDPMSEQDQSAYSASVKWLSSEMREMLGMGQTADAAKDNGATKQKGNESPEPKVR